MQGIEREKWEILSLHKIVNINHSAKYVMGNLVPAQNSISQSLSEMCEAHGGGGREGGRERVVGGRRRERGDAERGRGKRGERERKGRERGKGSGEGVMQRRGRGENVRWQIERAVGGGGGALGGERGGQGREREKWETSPCT